MLSDSPSYEKNESAADRDKDLEWHRIMIERYRETVRTKNATIRALETELSKLQPLKDKKNGDDEASNENELFFRSSPNVANNRRSLLSRNLLLDSPNLVHDDTDPAAAAQDAVSYQEELARSKQMCQNREQEMVGLNRIVVALQNENMTYRKKEKDSLVKQADLQRQILLLEQRLRVQPFDEKRMFETEQQIAKQFSIIQKLEAEIEMLQSDIKIEKTTIDQLKEDKKTVDTRLHEMQGEKESVIHLLEQSRAVAAQAFLQIEENQVKISDLQRQIDTMQQHETEYVHMKNSLHAAQIHITALEKGTSADKQTNKSETPRCNHVIQLSTDESNILEDELITLQKEMNVLSSDNLYLRSEVSKLESAMEEKTKEIFRVQDELGIFQQRLLESQDLCKEQDQTLFLQRTKVRDLEADLAGLKSSIIESSYGSLMAQTQIAKEMSLMDKYSSVDDAAAKSSMAKSLVDTDFQDDATDADLLSRYGPMDEKDDVFFQHYHDIISDLKLKLESKESEIQFIRTSLKSKDEVIVSLRNTLNHVKASQNTAAEVKSKTEKEKQASLVRPTEKSQQLKVHWTPNTLDDRRPHAEDEYSQSTATESFKNTMMEGLSSLKDMARQVIDPSDGLQCSPPRYASIESEYSDSSKKFPS